MSNFQLDRDQDLNRNTSQLSLVCLQKDDVSRRSSACKGLASGPSLSAGTKDYHRAYEWPDGTKYAGSWKKDTFHGPGKFTYPNGTTFEGNWVDGHANGFGILRTFDGCLFEGEWKNDMQHGKGKETNKDGSYYEGDYLEGFKHGKGV